jgi:hemoglobin
METIKGDIITREDIQLVINTFYNKVRDNSVIGHFFAHLDWDKHLPTMYSFWSTVILHEEGYKGNPFEKHLKLPNLKEEDLAEWVKLFHETIDEHFSGETAEAMKLRGETIAFIFKSKLVKN